MNLWLRKFLQAFMSCWIEFVKKPKKKLSIKTIERIIKLFQEKNPAWSKEKLVGCPQFDVSKTWSKYKIERL